MQFHAGPVIAVLVAIAIDTLVNHLVPITLIDATGSADILAANLTAHAVDRFSEAQLLGGTLQAGRAGRSPGVGLAQRCGRKSNRRNRN
jgi:hypothetical protein